ncbi:MAG: hypothetical protein ACFFD4_07970 [Candidatus Odinarchaeota archaeon]
MSDILEKLGTVATEIDKRLGNLEKKVPVSLLQDFQWLRQEFGSFQAILSDELAVKFELLEERMNTISQRQAGFNDRITYLENKE